jgi:hypothetical protein
VFSNIFCHSLQNGGADMMVRIVGWIFVLVTALGGLYFGLIGGLVAGGAVYLALSLAFPASVRMWGAKP